MSDVGVTSMTAELRRVAVRPPSTRGDYAAAHWAQPVDLDLLAKQHAAFVELLRRLGCEVDVLNPVDDMPDGIFTYDPCFVAGSGFIELRGAKSARVAEPVVLAAELPSGNWSDGSPATPPPTVATCFADDHPPGSPCTNDTRSINCANSKTYGGRRSTFPTLPITVIDDVSHRCVRTSPLCMSRSLRSVFCTNCTGAESRSCRFPKKTI